MSQTKKKESIYKCGERRNFVSNELPQAYVWSLLHSTYVHCAAAERHRYLCQWFSVEFERFFVDVVVAFEILSNVIAPFIRKTLIFVRRRANIAKQNRWFTKHTRHTCRIINSSQLCIFQPHRYVFVISYVPLPKLLCSVCQWHSVRLNVFGERTQW